MSTKPLTRYVGLVLVLGGLGTLWVLARGDGLLLSDRQRLRKAKAHVEAWELKRAEAVLAPGVQDTASSVEARRLYGAVLLERGKLTEAEEVLSRLAANDSLHRETARLNLARTYYYQGRLDSAAVLARDLAERGDTLLRARAHHLLGRVAFNRAAYEDAFAYQRRSLRAATAVESASAEADALRQLGVLHWYRAQRDSARTYYRSALRRYREVDDRPGEATTLSNIGLLYRDEGDWETNLRYQLKALTLRKQIGDQIGLADTYYFLATVHAFWHANVSFSIRYLQKSLDLSRQIGYAWGELTAKRAMQNIVSHNPALVQELGAWKDSLVTAQEEANLMYRIDRARQARRERRWDAAERHYRRAVHRFDSLGYRVGTYVLHQRFASVLVQQEKYQDAERVLLRARAHTAPGSRPRLAIDLRRARLYLAMDQPQRARRLLMPMTQTLDSLYVSKLRASTPDLAFEHAVRSLHAERFTAYRLLIEAMATAPDTAFFTSLERERGLPFWGGHPDGGEATGSPSRRAFSRFAHALERYEARGASDDVQDLLVTLGEVHQQLVVQRDLLAESVPTAERRPVPSLSTVQATLRPREVVLEYAVAHRHAYVLVIRPDTTHRLTLDVSPSELASIVDVYRRAVRRGERDARDDLWVGPARRLYDGLIAPVVDAGLLQAGDHLLVAPNHVLHLLPFHALPLPDNGPRPSFLIERYGVSYVPSASFLVEQRGQEGAPLRSVLAVAPQKRALPFTGNEVRHIQDQPVSYTKTLTNGQATADNVLRQMGRYDVVHVATHARMNAWLPLYSTLQMADRNVELHEILRQRLRARLVVLSACETGRGIGAFSAKVGRSASASARVRRIPTASSLVSFPRAFMTAGASSVMASLWLVDDASTAALMKRFYAHLGTFRATEASASPPDAHGVGAAVVQAQRQFLAEARAASETLHPFYWAAFYLLGDNR